MKFEDSEISKSTNYQKVILNFCTYYACDKYFILEVNEGEHFDQQKLETLIRSLLDMYSGFNNLAYVANRVNSYSIDPILWSYFNSEDAIIIASAIVIYRESTFFNANLEKQLSNISIKRASSLKEAIEWIHQLDELQY
ncbi:hypothetical protein [Winogradskyella immobilis]|uniref:SpoIIAA-like n=1 Tax=Winogradskyella immobilis TaxID=2816852 RepID=A0ABS8EKM4_9FLAO|nr:hypothetical protein [Winogradskyella immobilis]MCC1483751.1 hypothetical protein [Winogradskyella immobilis]MCG0015845.1 hypothetical protein [Winogradskyella immobilis]